MFKANVACIRRGFTLVELLVVIAIVSVLVAMMLPAVKVSKDVAKAGVCLSNMRQIGAGFAMYAQDWSDRIPPVGTPASILGGTRGASWFHYIGKAGYWGATINFTGFLQGFALSNTHWPVVRCPAETGGDTDPRLQGKPYYDNEMVAGSYVLNWSVSRYGYYPGYDPVNVPDVFRNGWYRGPRAVPAIQVSNAYIVFDCPNQGWGWAQSYSEWNIDNITTAYYTGTDARNPTARYDYAFRHPGKLANTLAMDGHAFGLKHYMFSKSANWRDLWPMNPP